MDGCDLPPPSPAFAHGIPPRAIPERMGVDGRPALLGQDELAGAFGDLLYADGGYVDGAGRSGEWARAWEHGSWSCVEGERLVLDVPAGTRALVLHADDISILLGLHPDHCPGRDPQRFTPGPRPPGSARLFHRLAEGLGVGLPHADPTARRSRARRRTPARTGERRPMPPGAASGGDRGAPARPEGPIRSQRSRHVPQGERST